jgi:hypothetical protein
MSMSDLSGTTKFDQNHICDNYDFWIKARAFVQLKGIPFFMT